MVEGEPFFILSLYMALRAYVCKRANLATHIGLFFERPVPLKRVLIFEGQTSLVMALRMC